MLAQSAVVEGKGSGNPPESQPTSSPAQPISKSQIPESSSSSQNTQSPRQTLEGNGFPHTRGPNFSDPSVDAEAVHKKRVTVWMEHANEITDLVQQTPHDSPLSRGHTPRSDEGSMTLMELTDLCTTMSQKVLDLEKVKTAQAKEIDSLQKRDIDDLVDEEVIVKDKGSGEKGESTAETASTARPDISAARPEVTPMVRMIMVVGLEVCVGCGGDGSGGGGGAWGEVDSLIMGDEHLDTILEKESDEFIKSSVENLVPNPSESEDEHSLIIYSSKIDLFIDEFADELIFLKSIPSGIDKADCDPEEEICLIEKLLYDNSSPRPPKEFISENSNAVIKSFSPSPIPVEDSDSLMEEIDLSLTPDDSMPPGVVNDDYDSEGDILILEEFLSNNSLSLPENKSFHFDIPSSSHPSTKPPDDVEIKPSSGILTVKVVGHISEHYVPMPRLLLIQPTLASNQEKCLHLLSHRSLKAFLLSSESPMMIYGENIPILDVLFLHFYPVDQL
nr:hypothetical protein [Tanacetum cinerariifolium]